MKFGSVELFDYQATDVKAALDGGHKSIFLAYEQALGKTITAIAWALSIDVQTVIVIGPKNTRKGWEKTLKMMAPEIPFRVLSSAQKDVANFGYLKEAKPGFYFIGWELMRTGAITNQRADLVIADEVHRIQNYGKSETELLFRYVFSEYKAALSGTPAANRPQGLFAPIHWLWPDRYRSYYTHFIEKFWLTRRNGSVIDLIREREPGMIIKDLPFFVRRLKKDHRGDLPPVLKTITIECPMTRAQAKVYKQFDEKALAWLGDHPVATSIPLVEEIRLRQVAIAEPTVVDGEVSFALNAKSSKVDTLIKDIVKDSGETFFAVTHSSKAIPMIVDKLNKAGIPARAFTGATKQDERDRLIDTLGTDYQVLVAAIASVAEGLDGLQHVCSNGVWISKHPNAMLNSQAGERLDRPGQKDSVQWWNLIAPDTSEERAEERLEEIADDLAELYDRY